MVQAHPQDRAISVPYLSKLISQLEPGQTLFIHGDVLPDAKHFEINLVTRITTPLHICFHFAEQIIEMNSHMGSDWGSEDLYTNPFTPGKPFDLRIRVHEENFEIFANNKHLANFKHRGNFRAIDRIKVMGDITLTGLHWGGRYFEMPLMTAFHGHAFENGQRVYVYGIPKTDFAVSLLGANKEELFRFNPKFAERKVVRNAMKNGVWGEEESEGSFPFDKGVGFDLAIHNETVSLQIYVNGERFCDFLHRNNNPLEDYKMLKITGDVELTGVEVSLCWEVVGGKASCCNKYAMTEFLQKKEVK